MSNIHLGSAHEFNTATHPELMRIQGRQDRIAFTGVTFRNFALHADINRLQMFCDNFLNFIDDPANTCGHYFKPAAPYVTLSMLNYGKMATESENLGWIAQHEVLFSIPLEWYIVNEKGELIFNDWAYVCPFIYVDNDQSLRVGREVYGWSKTRAWLEPVTSSWTADPRNPRRLMSMATELFPRLYAGERQEPRTLIEIVQDAPPSLIRSPFNTRDRYNPWWSASRNLRRSTAAMFNAFEGMARLPIFGYDGSTNLGTLSRMYRRGINTLLAGIPTIYGGNDTLAKARSRSQFNPHSPYMNNITLKQFRDAQNPDFACFQALVNSRVSVDRMSDGGLLGGPNLMMGDITGGYRIRLHQYAEQPIVDTLGLTVDNTERDEHGTPVAILSPVMPTWMACDLRYDMGKTLSWRTRESLWSANPAVPADDRPDKKSNAYNTARSAAQQESIGPLHYPDTTMRVLPLLADAEQLQIFCDEYLNKLGVGVGDHSVTGTDTELSKQIGKNRFEPWGSYVYMVITTYGEQMGKMYTDKNNLGQTADREMAFWIPVKWYAIDDETQEETLRVAIITPYAFCDSMRHTISEHEVNGRPVQHCRISSNDEYWLRESGPAADKKMLATLRTLVTPALNMGQPAEIQTLFEVMEGDVAGYNADIPWASIKANWRPELLQDNARKIEEKRQWLDLDSDERWGEIKELFTSVVTNKLPINFLNLKQYRATGEIDKYCYQALVLIKKRFNTLWDLREISPRMHVGVHKYPTVPIVERLGIKTKTVESSKERVVPQMEPIRPFFIRASLTEELGTNLYSRTLGQPWRRETSHIAGPDKTIQGLLKKIKEPKAIIESLLWDSWAGHDRSNPYRDSSLREYCEYDTPEERDTRFEEFFLRAGNFGMGPVNQQVFAANSPDEDQ